MPATNPFHGVCQTDSPSRVDHRPDWTFAVLEGCPSAHRVSGAVSEASTPRPGSGTVTQAT